MKIAMLSDIRWAFDSLTHVYNTTEKILRETHQVIRQPRHYLASSEAEKYRINAEIIERCDVVIAKPDISFLKARDRIGKHIPYLVLLLGGAPRGMPNLVKAWKYLRSTDVLVGNCNGDLEIIRAFFPNAQSVLLPFSIDMSKFFALERASRDKAKAALGFSTEDKILLYAGRITLEKNIHTLLLIFSILQKIDPQIHLIIAGAASDVPFEDFGVYPKDFQKVLRKSIDRIGVDKKRLHLVGHQTARQLQKLYSIADVFVNMTLHHDENFGLAQVEAMACGVPVVGTNWGGLKDTILHSRTGFRISTTITAAGVKSNWLEGASKILYLLNRTRQIGDVRLQCRRHVGKRYSLAIYRNNLDELLVKATTRARCPGARLVLSGFGRELWKVCRRRSKGPAPYRRGPKSLKLYRELIRPYAGGIKPSLEMAAGSESVYLPWPVTLNHQRELGISDPMFPMTLTIPVKYERILEDVLRMLRDTPVISIRSLTQRYLKHHDRAKAVSALGWMLDAGILIALRRKDARVVARGLSGVRDKPLFSIHRVNMQTNKVVLR